MDRGYRGGNGRGGSNRYGGGRPSGEGERRAPSFTKGTEAVLREKLRAIDHRGYPAYKDLTGCYTFPGFTLFIDHVQGDPFAAPSLLHVEVPAGSAGFPAGLYATREIRVAVADECLRRFGREIAAFSRKADGSGKSGVITCSKPGQEILERSGCAIDGAGNLLVRFHVGFPAAGRTILAGELEKILFDFLPACVRKALFYKNLDGAALEKVRALAVDQRALRDAVRERGLAAFVADNAVLPRESGVSQKPMRDAIPFASPESLRVEIDLPERGRITGMGIPRGITLIIGGGYHGKSTLLEALERGVYNHIRGDGREYVVTDESAVKVRAEDGRSVQDCDISGFIRNLPSGRDTLHFSSEDASGSTSQAAAVIEALEAGAGVVLMDEDTCATNFMVRDALMQEAVDAGKEPITPYLLRMRELYEKEGVSTILAAGSSGAFFAEADVCIQMDAYRPVDVTEKVHALAAARGMERGSGEERIGAFRAPDFSGRLVKASGELVSGDGRLKTKTLGRERILIGHAETDLRALEQLVDEEQTRTIVSAVAAMAKEMNGAVSVRALTKRWMGLLSEKGFQALGGTVGADLAMPRLQELMGAVNRLREIRVRTGA